jgi:hypothetical protein
MKRQAAILALAGTLFAVTLSIYAQNSSAERSLGAGVPSTVTPGTRFLAGLQDPLSTQNAKTGDRFYARTLEPLTTSDGTILPPGLEIRGHVDKVEAAHKTGRARMWLTFDDIQTRAGWVPLVADLTDIPGVHSIRVDYSRESEIEARTSKRQQDAEAAAAGALAGAAVGVAAGKGKDAAMGAAAGAASGFMAASGLGQEFTLAKGTKLELIIDRPLYVGRF